MASSIKDRLAKLNMNAEIAEDTDAPLAAADEDGTDDALASASADEAATAPSPAPEPWQDVIYDPGGISAGWYAKANPVSVTITEIGIIILCILMIKTNPTAGTIICAAFAFVGFNLYYIAYMYRYHRSRKLITRKAVLTEDSITVTCEDYEKTFALDDLALTFSYSSASTLAVIVATADDYAVITTSSGYLFSKGGKEVLRPIYKLNKFFMDKNKNHINYMRNKKYKKRNPFKVPNQVFEIEFDTPKVDALIAELRTQLPYTPAD